MNQQNGKRRPIPIWASIVKARSPMLAGMRTTYHRNKKGLLRGVIAGNGVAPAAFFALTEVAE